MTDCEHLDDILATEIVIIRKELAKEVKSRSAVAQFIEAHGEEMRATYCGNVCPDRSSCELAQKYIKLGGTEYGI